MLYDFNALRLSTSERVDDLYQPVAGMNKGAADGVLIRLCQAFELVRYQHVVIQEAKSATK